MTKVSIMDKYNSGISEIHQLITKIMKQKKWFKPWEIQNSLNIRRVKRIAESTVSRELRRMPNVVNRRCDGDSWDYCLECKV